MGLGKSLTTLALIAGTLPHMRELQTSSHDRATLLIVPASSMWLLSNHVFTERQVLRKGKPLLTLHSAFYVAGSSS